MAAFEVDAVVVGSGPNGLTAAAVLAQAGCSVQVIEAADTIGGATRTGELTLPGFAHDLCSAVHPMGVLSPAFRALDLEAHGLEWLDARFGYAHPLDDGPAVLAELSLDATAERLGEDADAWRALCAPFLANPEVMFDDLLAPLRFPRQPLTMTRFGLRAVRSARGFANHWFKTEPARALFAGCAGHSFQSLDNWLTAAFGLVFAISAHARPWPVARGGSRAITDALAQHLRSNGGQIQTGKRVQSMADLPSARAVFFDIAPTQVAAIAGDALPAGYRRRLDRYVYGPGAFKVDWALDGPIPWTDPRCAEASTVHVGGTLAEIAASEGAVWRGEHPDNPFLIVCQQSHLDPGRAPEGQHTGYAYCHVPAGSEVDRTAVIEGQIERFAPGFRDRILARFTRNARQFEQHNPSHVGGAVTGGPALPTQLFTRPVSRLNPYTTPNPRLYLCSQATPPGGGVHGMCGFHAARTALGRTLR